MELDLWSLYRQMLRSRRFEEAVRDLWVKGLISGEMHMGLGEEAIAAGVVGCLEEGDAMALDHRGTPPLVVWGVDLVLLLREFLGRSDGLCSGMGGHMHLFFPEHLAASSGIVGATGPTAAGFALAAQYLRPGKLAVAFFGEGALNQGMLMESMNLAVIWKLPVLFVCKDNEWAISTRSSTVTGGSLTDRAKSLGMYALEVDGTDVEAVWHAASKGAEGTRNGHGPTFLLAHCVRLEGHFLGDPLLRIIRKPVDEMKQLVKPLLRSATSSKGTSLGDRASSFGTVISLIIRSMPDPHWSQKDPLVRIRRKLKEDKARLDQIEKEVEEEIQQVVETALSD